MNITVKLARLDQTIKVSPGEDRNTRPNSFPPTSTASRILAETPAGRSPPRSRTRRTCGTCSIFPVVVFEMVIDLRKISDDVVLKSSDELRSVSHSPCQKTIHPLNESNRWKASLLFLKAFQLSVLCF